MNPLDVMDFPVGVLEVMDEILKDEERARRRAEARAKSRRGRR